MRIDLPDDNWAELRDPAKVTEAARRPVLRNIARLAPETRDALSEAEQIESAAKNGTDEEKAEAKLMQAQRLAGIQDADLDRLEAANDHAIVAFVSAWSYEQPVTLEAALQLPYAAFNALREAVAPLVLEVLVDFTPKVDEGGAVDRDSPFVPSVESNGHSEEGPSIIAIPSPTSGEPINSSASG